MDGVVGIRELRQQASAILRRVSRGEVITLTERGRPIARIVPLQSTMIEQLILEGRVTEAEGDLLEIMDELDLPIEPGQSMLPSQALMELRSNER